RTWTRLGRRRPYFLAGSILSSLVLFFVPDVPTLWMAAASLWLMDTCFNICMEPFRAFVGDKLREDQRTMGFIVQSFFIGLGGTIGGFLPRWLEQWGVAGTAANWLPLSLYYAFKIGGAIFLVAVLWTVFTSTEEPPEDLEEFRRRNRREGGFE